MNIKFQLITKYFIKRIILIFFDKLLNENSLNQELKMKNKKFNLYYFLIIISILLLMFSIFNIFLWIKDKEKTKIIEQNIKKNLNKQINYENNNNEINTTDIYDEYANQPFLQIDFSNLLLTNNETVGWIKVNGTNIDYPIVQSKDNKYYLNHSFDKSESKAGWIFLDFRNNLDDLDKNTIIYGHGRLDNTMFGNMRLMLEDSWLKNDNNHIIQISTPKYNMIFQIFSIYTIFKETYYITTNFNEYSFQEFLKTITERSIFNFNTSTNNSDNIITLSTCKNNFGDRIVVHAKLIKKETR